MMGPIIRKKTGVHFNWDYGRNQPRIASRDEDERNATLEAILAGSVDYEDGTVGVGRCVEQYCTDHGIDQELGHQALKLYVRQEARAAGIPLSVIEGRSKLSDHFSKEYIESQCGFETRINGASRTGDE